ncbi:MAG: UDP-N-acetylglucosamine 1-carboxyvinyltransferase [Microthrixaceae bacterium]
MSRLIVRPSGPLSGEVVIGGAKNSALKLMAATLLAPGRYVLRNVPDIADVDTMSQLLEAIGCSVRRREDDALEIERPERVTPEAPYELVEQMRASTAVLGPLLASEGRASVAKPGGDNFGDRPIDMHLRSLEQLGATFELSHGVIEGRADGLVGRPQVLEYPSVGATENLLMAAVLASGTTTIENAACEPEIADLAAFLNRMGAHVLGAGSPTITIEGVETLHPVEHVTIPDRIEVATYLSAVGVAGGEVTLRGARSDHLEILIERMGHMGLRISPEADGLWVRGPERPRATDLVTLPYPGLATDHLPLLVAVLSIADGTSFATENVFANRFRYVGELGRMGANIRVDGHHLVIDGVDRLEGAPVQAVDIRAGAALVVAGLGADGETVIHDAHHVDRGYASLVEQLARLGADISRDT